MRILFLTSRLPYPPNRGDRLRAFNFLRSLSSDHEIHLVSFYTDVAERAHIEPLRAICRSVDAIQMKTIRSILTTGLNFWRQLPLQALYYQSGTMQGIVDRAVQDTSYDVVYAHLFRMAPYLRQHSHLYRVVDLTDLISLEITRSLPYRNFVSRFLYAIEKTRIEGYERDLAKAFEEIWLISEADHQALEGKCPDANIRVVPNGVDTDRFHPISPSEKLQPDFQNQIIFVGHMSVFHNVDAAAYLAQEILPLVQREVPDATLKLVGADPSPRVLALDRLPGVHVAGFVNDLNLALNRASVFAAPLRFAAGVQNKVLEAMATGLPVVTTSLVNQGLGAQPGRDLLVADDPLDLASQVVNLLRHPQVYRLISLAGRRFVQNNFHWNFVRERMNAIENTLQR